MSIMVRELHYELLKGSLLINSLFVFSSTLVSSNGQSQVSNQDDDSSNDELNVESELENFEKLLNQMMQFRPATSEMSREDRLNCAQGFAEVFEKLIMQDEDVNDLDND